jgi:hypothetical protein
MTKIDNLIYLTSWKFTRSKIFNGQVTIFNQSNYQIISFALGYGLLNLHYILFRHLPSIVLHFVPVGFLCSPHESYDLSTEREKTKITNLTYLTSSKFTWSKIFNGRVTMIDNSSYPSYFFSSNWTIINFHHTYCGICVPLFSSPHSFKFFVRRLNYTIFQRRKID